MSAALGDLPAELDSDQAEVVAAAPEVRRVVLAPPGSGKTQVVAARVDTLHRTHDVSTVDEVLVLSFSRAAVTALRARLGVGTTGPMPTIRTIDSLASMLLDEAGSEEWQDLDHDGRIERARAVLRAGKSDLVSVLRHVIVDEMQDLVGERAGFVLDLLRSMPRHAGFTVLGDPRQALYDFQLSEVGDLKAESFLRALRDLGEGSVLEKRLRHQYRARSAEARSVAALGASDLSSAPWHAAVRERLGAVLTVGEVNALARPIGRWEGSTAVLCRTNGDALVAAGLLRASGLPVSLRHRAQAQPLGAWVADAVAGASSTVTKNEVLRRLEGQVEDPDSGWRLLKATERNFRVAERIDVSRLTRRLEVGDYPAALAAAGGPVVVSTVHRAKGLEFDHVVLVDPEALKAPEQVAVAYVALTRARDRLVAAGLDRPRYLQLDRAIGRWVVGGHKRWMTTAIELRPGDVLADADIDAASPDMGAEVTAVFDRRASTLEVPVWKIALGTTGLGRTSPQFGAEVARRVKPGGTNGRWGWPDLVGAGVDGVVTGVVWDSQAKPQLRRVPCISGMASFRW